MAAIYSRLLRLCPSELRTHFAEEMTIVFADDLTDTLEHDGPAAASRACAAKRAIEGVSRRTCPGNVS